MANLMNNLMDNPLLHIGAGLLNANQPYILPLGSPLPARGLGAGLMQGMATYGQHQNARAEQDIAQAEMQMKLMAMRQAQEKAAQAAQLAERQSVARDRIGPLMSPMQMEIGGQATTAEPDYDRAIQIALQSGQNELAGKLITMQQNRMKTSLNDYIAMSPEMQKKFRDFRGAGSTQINLGSGKEHDSFARGVADPTKYRLSGKPLTAELASAGLSPQQLFAIGADPVTPSILETEKLATQQKFLDKTSIFPIIRSVIEEFERLDPEAAQVGPGFQWGLEDRKTKDRLEGSLDALAVGLTKRPNPTAEPNPGPIELTRGAAPDYMGSADYPTFIRDVIRWAAQRGVDPRQLEAYLASEGVDVSKYPELRARSVPPPPPGATVD